MRTYDHALHALKALRNFWLFLASPVTTTFRIWFDPPFLTFNPVREKALTTDSMAFYRREIHKDRWFFYLG